MIVSDALHAAAQYLASVALQLIPKEDNDSHSNLGLEDGVIYTRAIPILDEHMTLDVENFTLGFTKNEAEFDLAGAKHGEVLAWLQHHLGKHGFKTDFAFHYHLSYHDWQSEQRFPLPDEDLVEELLDWIDLRSATHQVLEELYPDLETRIWPHHFDTGALKVVEEKNGDTLRTIGFGLAIPDDICSEHYLYVSAWTRDGRLDIPESESKHTIWNKNGFQGAVLPVSAIQHQEDITSFFESSEEQLMKVLKQ